MTETAVLSSGQHVRIQDAEPGAPDPKGLVYYDYFRNLKGEVVKSYPDGTVAISVERSSLPLEIRTRHEQNEKAQQERWLNGLSDEERNKLSAREKRFSLKYTVLVASKHVVPDGETAENSLIGKQGSQDLIDAPQRKTSADLEAAEAAYLAQKNQSK